MTDLTTTDQQASGALSVELRLRKSRDAFEKRLEHAYAPRTRRTYIYEWERFERWCLEHNLPSLPTTAEVVETYFGHLSVPGLIVDTKGRTRERKECSASTFIVIRAAIKIRHEMQPKDHPGRDLELDTPELKRFIKASRRSLHAAGREPNKAEPFTVDDWLLLRDRIGTSMHDIRDLALLGLGIVRALRGPSELMALDLGRRTTGRGALHLREEGAVLLMHTTKSEQEGGSERPIDEGPALEAVRAWIAAAGINQGEPLWRGIKILPHTDDAIVSQKRMSGVTLQQVVRKRAAEVLRLRDPNMSVEEAKERAAAYSTHSLRRGALTSLGQKGATLSEMMELSRHSKSSAGVVLGYVKTDAEGARRMQKMGM